MGINSKDKRDAYYYKAKSSGYRARSAFKLLDIQNTFKIFEGVQYVVDLCAAPGSWSQVLSELENVKIVAVDIQEIAPIEGVIDIKADITAEDCMNKIKNLFNSEKADLIVCDGAPDVTGFHDLDEYLQKDLLKAALSVALETAKPGSTFVGKCFRGEFTAHIISHFLKFYGSVLLVKPRSSRAASMECFLLCRGLKKNILDDPKTIELVSNHQGYSVISCGDGPESDFAFEGVDGAFVPRFKPINPPYQDAINLRRMSLNNK